MGMARSTVLRVLRFPFISNPGDPRKPAENTYQILLGKEPLVI
jgi:hypothetical protein